MKLRGIQKGGGVVHKLKLKFFELSLRVPPSDVVRVLFYRSAFFGAPMRAYFHDLLRGRSEWTVGERELFATFASHCNECAFCTGAHRAIAERALGEEVVDAVLKNYRTAKINEPVRAVLGFLQKMARDPNGICAEDVRAVLAEGVSVEALRNAIQIAEGFAIINRVADALGFELPPASMFANEAEFLLKRGYKPM
jgi:uncharacterized peroxidase-related enzyme